MNKSVLTIETLVVQPSITIDGVGFPMQTADDFGLLDLARVERMQRQLNDLLTRVDDLSDTDLEALAGILDGLTALVLPTLPAERRAKLRDGHKLAIVQAFQRATELHRAGVPSQSLPPNPPTSAP